MGVGIASVLVVLVLAFAGAMGVQARRIARERDRANIERDRANAERDRANLQRDRANQIAQFMTSMFTVSNPSEARGNTVTAREILDKASKEIETGLATQPDLRGYMTDVMTEVYLNLGLFSEARAMVSRSLELTRAALGPDHVETLRSANLLGKILAMSGHRTRRNPTSGVPTSRRSAPSGPSMSRRSSRWPISRSSPPTGAGTRRPRGSGASRWRP